MEWATINTDVSYRRSTNVASWCFYIRFQEAAPYIRTGIFGDFPPSAAAAELMAIVNALSWVHRNLPGADGITINTDSKTAVDMTTSHIAHEGAERAISLYRFYQRNVFKHIRVKHLDKSEAIADKRLFVNSRVDEIAKMTREKREVELAKSGAYLYFPGSKPCCDTCKSAPFCDRCQRSKCAGVALIKKIL